MTAHTAIHRTTSHAMVKCTSKACKHVVRIAFEIEYKLWAYLGRPHSSQALVLDETRVATFRDKHELDRMLFRANGTCRSCQAATTIRLIRGTYVADMKCGAKCMGATGPSCECSCGGKNHGGKFS